MSEWAGHWKEQEAMDFGSALWEFDVCEELVHSLHGYVVPIARYRDYVRLVRRDYVCECGQRWSMVLAEGDKRPLSLCVACRRLRSQRVYKGARRLSGSQATPAAT